MIFKSYQINKIDISQNKYVLFHGKNENLRNTAIKELTKNKNEVLFYDEKEILMDQSSFIESTLNKSFFENEKLIVVKRASDKILKIIEEITSKAIEDLMVIIDTENLDKKSKLRKLFEKKYVCVAFYPDTPQTLSKLTYQFFQDKKISISPSNVNLIVSKSNGDRQNLINELKKIENFCKEGKEISYETLIKLTNLNEDYSVSEIIDNCLVKNKKKLIYMLNENNFSNEDGILIIRTFLNKSKKILALSKEYENNKSIDITISSARPPIFWKDKEIIKEQIYKWTPKKIKNLIFKLNELELLIKKNITNSKNLVTDFLLEQVST
jgi:DNA polymerase-3 subunit delta|tara:strand:- start:1623 stop:2597 length:975 start_codon:yes stop_codon:yes gene_type:complete